MEKYNIIILVLTCDDNSLYSKLTTTIRNTWGDNKDKDVKVVYYYYKNNIDESYFDDENNCLYLKGVEDFTNIGKKTIDAFEWIKNNFEFNYLFRTNCSSYININELKKFVSNKPKDNYCSAKIGEFNNSIKFPSGCGYFLSNDLVKLILDNKNKFNYNLIDDVALGCLLSDLNITITNDAERIDIIKEDLHGLMNIKNYHYRCKHENNRELDIKIIKELYKLYRND